MIWISNDLPFSTAFRSSDPKMYKRLECGLGSTQLFERIRYDDRLDMVR